MAVRQRKKKRKDRRQVEKFQDLGQNTAHEKNPQDVGGMWSAQHQPPRMYLLGHLVEGTKSHHDKNLIFTGANTACKSGKNMNK